MIANRSLIAGLLLTAAWCSQVRAQGMPEHVQKALDRLVGKWQVKNVEEGRTTNAVFEAEWSPGKASFNYRWSGTNLIGEQPMTAAGSTGWDGSSKTVRERCFGSDGSTFEATHSIDAQSNQWTSPSQGTFANMGKFAKVANLREFIVKSEDEWVVVSKDRKIDGQAAPSVTSTFVREKSPAAQYLDFWKPMAGTWKTRSDENGKQVEGTARWELSPSKSCYLSQGTAEGQPASHSIEAYDPVLQAWKAVGFDAAGDSWTLVVHITNMNEMKQMQAGVKGTYEIYRSLANGKTQTDTGAWSFPTWDDRQHLLELTNVMRDGQPQPNAKVHYERQP